MAAEQRRRIILAGLDTNVSLVGWVQAPAAAHRRLEVYVEYCARVVTAELQCTPMCGC